MKILGIDIGTTTVSVVMTDTETGKLLAKETVEHNSFLRSSKPEQKLQNPERIYEIVRELLIKQQKENGLPIPGRMEAERFRWKTEKPVQSFCRE